MTEKLVRESSVTRLEVNGLNGNTNVNRSFIVFSNMVKRKR